jgi:hypothetical protein
MINRAELHRRRTRLFGAGEVAEKSNQTHLKISASSCGVFQLLRWVPEDGSGAAGVQIDEDKCRPVDAVIALPLDAEVCLCLFDVDGLGLSVACQRCGKPIPQSSSQASRLTHTAGFS